MHTVFYLVDSCYLECRTSAIHISDSLPCLSWHFICVTKKTKRADHLFFLAIFYSEVRHWCLCVCRGLAGSAGPHTQCSHLESLIKHGNLIYSNTALISAHQFSTWATCLTFIITWLIESPAVGYTAQPHTSEELPTRWPGCSDTQSAHFTTGRRLSSFKTETACKDGRSHRDVTQPWDRFTVSGILSLPDSFETGRSSVLMLWDASNDWSLTAECSLLPTSKTTTLGY